ncbi:sensor histidine kinase [Clostridium neonatale]
MIDSEEEKHKIILMKHQFECQVNHIKNLEKFYNDTSKIQHDMKNHIICLKSLAFNNNLSELKSYLLKLDDTLKKSALKIKTGNPISDCIINEKLDIASTHNIGFNCNFIIPKNSSIDSFDLCILLGNSLDNAIDACNKITSSTIKKEINLKSYIRDLFMIIEIINSKQEPIKYINNKIESTKPNKLIHGIGLDNIREIAKKYDGIVDIIEEKNLFNLYIMLKIKNRD